MIEDEVFVAMAEAHDSLVREQYLSEPSPCDLGAWLPGYRANRIAAMRSALEALVKSGAYRVVAER